MGSVDSVVCEGEETRSWSYQTYGEGRIGDCTTCWIAMIRRHGRDDGNCKSLILTLRYAARKNRLTAIQSFMVFVQYATFPVITHELARRVSSWLRRHIILNNKSSQHRYSSYQHLRIAIAISPFVTRTQAYGKQRDRIESKALTKAFSTVVFSYAELSMSHVFRMRQRCSCAPSVGRSEGMFCKLSCVYFAVFGERVN
jgi:hypothetical protein